MQNSAVLTCTLSIQEVSSSGGAIKQSTHKGTTLTIGRDEFREIQLRLDLPQKMMRLTVREVLVHKKFIKDGKASLRLPDQNLLLMLSNCPPNQLVVFVKTLQTKLELLRQNGFVHQRKRLLSEVPRAFNEISPLTVKDLQMANTNTRSATGVPASASSTNGELKRKAVAGSDENRLPSLPPCKQPKLRQVSPSKVIAHPVVLNQEQNMVLDAVLKGRSIFFTGSAGTGKSFLLKRIIGALPPQHTFPTASTGVAACHIGGTTLHSFAGIGSGKSDLAQCIEMAKRPTVAQQWRKCHHLIIDEISMVDGDYFKKLEAVARAVRNSDQPFGGIQLIVCGDFLQLPPVSRDKAARFCFQTTAWHRCIKMTLELKEVRRQSDHNFIKVLQAVRMGICPTFVADTLEKTASNIIERDGILATKLCTHKEDVAAINTNKLHHLPGETRTFTATDSDDVFSESLDKLCPAMGRIDLKVGAQVLLCKNLEVGRGLVNGARGIVTAFDSSKEGLPIVKFVCGVQEVIKPTRWTFRMGAGLLVTRKQVPLKLAWAISIHKSQGMTLDCVEIMLAKVFEFGQAYVALSRAKNLEGMRVLGFTPSCIRANEDVLRFYEKLDIIRRAMRSSQSQNRPSPGTSDSSSQSTMKLW